ncbi:glycosyl hydrolase family 8 [Shouchella clausii]
MDKRITWRGTAVLLLLLCTGCFGSGPAGQAANQGVSAGGNASGQPDGTSANAAPASAAPTPASGSHAEADMREALYRFVDGKLSGPYGVYTNLIDTNQAETAATGHEVLSESASLLMRYAVFTGQRELFDAEWNRAKAVFDQQGGFSYRYSPKQDRRYPVNAAVDDLRMIRALYEAGEAFGDDSYRQEADGFGRRFLEHNTDGERLYDFYDDQLKLTNDFVTLCYIDLTMLQKLSSVDVSYNKMTKNMEDILQNGYISDAFPFYQARYNYETGGYASEHIYTVESLLSILSLAEAGKEKQSSIDYLKQQIEGGALYGEYSMEGKPLNDIQSTAIYAIAAMIGAEVGDKKLYEDSIGRMNAYRINDPSSPLYGGFGDTGSGQAYSFDNLMALLAYAYPLKS